MPHISVRLDDRMCFQLQERYPPRIQKETPKDEFLLPLVSLGMGSIAKALDGIGNDLTVETSSCLGVGMSFTLGESSWTLV